MDKSEENRQKTVNSNGTDELTDKTDMIKGAKYESKRDVMRSILKLLWRKKSPKGSILSEVGERLPMSKVKEAVPRKMSSKENQVKS